MGRFHFLPKFTENQIRSLFYSPLSIKIVRDSEEVEKNNGAQPHAPSHPGSPGVTAGIPVITTSHLTVQSIGRI